MAYYASRAAFLQANPDKESKLVDVDGTPLNVNDTVQIIEDVSEELQGVITGFDGCPCAQVSFPDKTDKIVSCRCLRVVTAKTKENEDVERVEDIAKKLVASLGKSVSVAAIEGKVYELCLIANEGADALVQRLAQTFALQVRTFRRDANLKVEEATRKLNNSVSMPSVTLRDVEKGHMLYLSEGDIVHVLPFHYAPRYILTREQTYELSDRHKALLTKELKTHIWVRRNYVSNVQLTTIEFGLYESYHGSGTECLGTLERYRAVSSVSDIINFRDRHQRMLEAINYSSLARSRPSGLPDVSDLIKDGKKSKKIGSWELEPLVVGSLVKIVRTVDAFPERLVGVVGKIIDVQTISRRYAVELLFEFKNGHSCEGSVLSRNGYYFPRECLEPADEGSARTRKDPGVKGGETTAVPIITISTTTTLDIEGAPALGTTPPDRGWTTGG